MKKLTYYIFIFAFSNGAIAQDKETYSIDIQSFEQTRLVNELVKQERYHSCELKTVNKSYVLKYIGKSDYDLVSCISNNKKYNFSKLIITSQGGETVSSSIVGLYLKYNNVDVDIFGICLSSCANYIAPAAHKLAVGKYSILGLHGAPGLPDQYDLEKIKKSAEGLAPSNASASQKIIDNSIRSIDFNYNTHLLTSNMLNVSPGWYDLIRFDNYISLNDDFRNTFVVPDFEMTKSCLSRNIKIDTFSYNELLINKIREIYPFSGSLVFTNKDEKKNCK